MADRLLKLIFSVLFLIHLHFGSVSALEAPVHGLDDAAFHDVLTAVKANPTKLSDYPFFFTNASQDQIAKTIDAIGTTHFTFIYPVAVKGYDLMDLKGTPLNDLSLIVFHENKPTPIPFQFDEFDISGLIFIQGISSYPMAGQADVLDEEDELLFMFRDAGLMRYDPAEMPADLKNRIIKEIVLTTPHQKKRYVYLVRDLPQRSKADYVGMNISKGEVFSTFYRVTYDTANMAGFINTVIKTGVEQHKDLIDVVYLEVSTGILTELLRVSLNSVENIKPIPLAVKDGPIRATAIIEIKIVVGGIPFYRDRINICFYEFSVNFRSRFTTGSIGSAKYMAYILKNPKARVVMDLNNFAGAKYTTQLMAAGNFRYGIVDGKTGAFAREFNTRSLPGDWLWMDSNQGWELFISNHLPVVPGGLFDAFLEGMHISLNIEDDPNSTFKYERYPGADPRLSITVEGLPHTLLNLMSATKDVPLDYETTVTDFVNTMIDLDKGGKLKDLDKIVRKILINMKKQGKITTHAQLANALINDFNRVGFKGMKRDTFNQLIRMSLKDLTDFSDYSTGKIIADFKHHAEAMGVDLRDLRSAPLDNTLYMIDTVGKGGPEAFFKEITHPPEVIIQSWPPSEEQ